MRTAYTVRLVVVEQNAREPDQMIYRITSSHSTSVFDEIHKLGRYDKGEIAAAKAGVLTTEIGIVPDDMVRKGDCMPLFSARFVALLRERGMHSFVAHRVALCSEGRTLDYFYLEPTRYLKPVPANRIDHDTLDLNNVFLSGDATEIEEIAGIPGVFELLCGERLRTLAEEASCTGIVFEPVGTVPFDSAGNPLFFYDLAHGWATKYYWLSWNSEPARSSDSGIPLSRYSGTTLGDAHGTTLGKTVVSSRVRSFFQSQGSDALFRPVETDDSAGNAELWLMQTPNLIPSTSTLPRLAIASTLKGPPYGDMSRWNGRDPFGVSQTGWILIGHETMKLMKAERFQNVEFRRMRYWLSVD